MSTLRGLMGSRWGKKAIRDELASEERCVEQWHHEERFTGILGASVRLQSRSPLMARAGVEGIFVCTWSRRLRPRCRRIKRCAREPGR